MTKLEYINAIKQLLGCKLYQAYWAPYNDPAWQHDDFWDYYTDYDTKAQAITACRKHGWDPEKVECLIEFYVDESAPERMDYMHGPNEMECLKKLYNLLFKTK